MTGVRVSAVFKPEQEIGVEDSTKNWLRFPSKVSFKHQATNNMREYYSIGSGFIDNATAGMFTGTWEVGFVLDYRYLNILGAVFEGYEYDSSTGTHTFYKVSGKRVPSMSIRVKKLNRFVDGSKDQTIILKGCVAKSISINQSSGNAPLECRLSGQYVDELSDYSNLDSTDYPEYYDGTEEPIPVEWACMVIGATPVANTESVSFSVENNLQLISGCGSRFYTNYDEGPTSISLSTSCYSKDPEVYYQKMYSGGFDSTLTAPRVKNLKPIPEMSIRSSYDENDDGQTEYSFNLVCSRVWVNSSGQYNFDSNSKILDSPQFKVSNFKLKIKSDTGRITVWE